MLCHGGGGGSTRAAIDLATALDRRGHNVLLISLGRPRWLPPSHLRHAIIRCDRGSSLRLDAGWAAATIDAIAHDLATICRREEIGLLHLHYGLPFVAAATVARTILGHAAPPIVATLHGTDITAALRDPAVGRALGAGLRHAAAVTTVSTAYADLLRGSADLPAAVVVPNFIPDDRLVPAPRHRRTGRRPPTMIHVSNFRDVKDIRGLARAFIATRRRCRCRLLLVGDGPGWRGIADLLRGWPADVRMLGFRRDVPALLRQADLLLLTSREESFSLAALEAMAAGLPVIAPRVGGLPEVIRDGVGGRLFHPGRIADAGAKLLALLGSPIMLRRLAIGARSRAACFREADVVARYEGLYRSVLGRHPVAAPTRAIR